MSSNLIDRAKNVRDGEELDQSRLLPYLRAHVPHLEGSLIVEQFPAGFSNLTYLLRFPERELVLRRPPFGAKIKTAHDMEREYKILSHLYPVYGKVPRPLLFCDDESVLGAKFFVMERVAGVILRSQAPKGLELSPRLMRRLSEAFVENLVEIHGVDYNAAGLAELGQPEGYVMRQVNGWTKRYQNARTDSFASVEQLAEWLAENAPPDSPKAALIHNDYKYDNVVLAPEDLSRIIAILDWEMATIGDPLMDLGTSLGYWVDPDDPPDWQKLGFGLTAMPGSLNRREVLSRYEELSGDSTGDFVFYYAFGLMKIAVIVQQIYFRYRQGLTKDPRFANLDVLIDACGRMALRAIERGQV